MIDCEKNLFFLLLNRVNANKNVKFLFPYFLIRTISLLTLFILSFLPSKFEEVNNNYLPYLSGVKQ